MIVEHNLVRSIRARKPSSKPTAFLEAQEYRQRADEYASLYLTRFVLYGTPEDRTYNDAVADYCSAVRKFEADIRIKETHYPCKCIFELNGGANDPRYLKTEALLAHGNAIKESFVSTSKAKKDHFDSLKEEATSIYNQAFEYAHEISYGPYGQFTLLEQMNLEARAKSWRLNKIPKRIVVFHTTRSPISLQILKGVFYYALRCGVEVWEYSEGRIPRSAIGLAFLKDRLLECCGIVFLASAEYAPGRDNIEFEIRMAKVFRDAQDPAKLFALNLDANDEFRAGIGYGKRNLRDPRNFDTRFPKFLESLEGIYECRRSRLRNDALWDRLEQMGLDRRQF